MIWDEYYRNSLFILYQSILPQLIEKKNAFPSHFMIYFDIYNDFHSWKKKIFSWKIFRDHILVSVRSLEYKIRKSRTRFTRYIWCVLVSWWPYIQQFHVAYRFERMKCDAEWRKKKTNLNRVHTYSSGECSTCMHVKVFVYCSLPSSLRDGSLFAKYTCQVYV